MRRLSGEAARDVERVELPCTLKVRESTGPPDRGSRPSRRPIASQRQTKGACHDETLDRQRLDRRHWRLASPRRARSAADKPVYGVLMKTLSNPFWGAMEKGVDEGAKKAGVDIFLQAVESDQAAEPQLNACNTMLEKKPAVMITAAINSTILLPCLKDANGKKIPVIDLDNNLDPAITKKAGVDGRLSYRLRQRGGGCEGRRLARRRARQGRQGQGAGDRGPIRQHHRREAGAGGFAAELKKAAPGLTIVASLPGDWDSLKAANITNDTLQRDPDLTAIFCANDDMALGAVEAARAAGKDKLIVIGVDGNSNAVKSILAGRLNASVAQLPYLVGMEAVENAKKVLAGEKVPEFTYVPTLVLTKAVLEAKKEPMLQYVK